MASHDALHHCIAVSPWDEAALEEELFRQADRLVGGPDAYLIVDDMAPPKKGTASVGVAPQYASALGKNANYQTLVLLMLSSGEVPVSVALRLFLPEIWTADPARLAKAGVPENWCEPRTKPGIALAEIDGLVAAGVSFSVALADAGYGISVPFRHGLSARALLWAVGIPRIQKVIAADLAMVPPAPARRQSTLPLVPAEEATSAEAMLADEPWETISWRQGRKGALRAKFAAKRVRIAEGPVVRLHGRNNQHMPREEAWLVGEHPSSGDRKNYLSNLPTKADLKTVASIIKARWSCEQAHQQMKEELGPDHFQGRSWRGLHRHPLMTMMAMAFLQHRLPGEAGRGKEPTARHPAPACGPCATPSSQALSHRARPSDVPTADNGSGHLKRECQNSARRYGRSADRSGEPTQSLPPFLTNRCPRAQADGFSSRILREPPPMPCGRMVKSRSELALAGDGFRIGVLVISGPVRRPLVQGRAAVPGLDSQVGTVSAAPPNPRTRIQRHP